MLNELIKDRIYFKDEVNGWEEAIKIAAGPLLEENFIKPEYVDAMIENVHTNGAYMIVVPGFAMPHAKTRMWSDQNRNVSATSTTTSRISR